MPIDVTFTPCRKGRPKRSRRWLLLLALLAVNAGVVLYHGDPRDHSEAPSTAPAVDDPESAQSSLPDVGASGEELSSAPMGLAAEVQQAACEPSPAPLVQWGAVTLNPLAGLRMPGPVQRVAVVKLRARQTVADAMAAAGVQPESVNAALHSMKEVVDFRRMQPGHEIRLRFDSSDTLLSMDVRRGVLDRVRTRLTQGVWQAQRIEVPVYVVTSTLRGNVQRSLWEAVIEMGEDPRLALELAEIFAWDIDFYTEVYKDDTFCILVEKRFAEGRFLEYGPVLAAEFVSLNNFHRGFRHRHSDGKVSYYDPTGRSLRKQLLKSPLKYGHVTSSFGKRRHPVLRYTRVHYGVDYGVPMGTPTWSVGDGRVVRAGRHGGFGKLIEIRHANGWLSQYAHLSRTDVRVGQRVTQKQTIGRTGNTGLSSGPHLHYGLKKDGRYVNPSRQKFERGRALGGEELQEFKARVIHLTEKLQAAEVAHNPSDRVNEG